MNSTLLKLIVLFFWLTRAIPMESQESPLTQTLKAAAALVATLPISWASGMIHELGHAYAAKQLFNIKSKINCPCNPITFFKEGPSTTFEKQLPPRGLYTAAVFAAGPLSEIAMNALLYKLANNFPAKGNLSYFRAALKIKALTIIMASTMHLLVPYSRNTGNQIKISDGTHIWHALGFGQS